MAPGYCPAHDEVASGDENARIELVRSVSVSGIVVMPDGAPAEDANVSLGHGELGCDEQGRFEFEAPAAGSSVLHAWLGQDLAASTEVALAEGGSVADVRLVLRPRVWSFARLRIVDRGGRGIPRADIPGRWRERSDDEGRMTIPHAEPAGTEVELTVRASGYFEAIVSTRTRPSDAGDPVDVVLDDGVAVLLDVRAAGGGALDAHAHFSGADWCMTDSSYRLDPEATYEVSIHAKGFLRHEIQAYRPPPGGGVLFATLRPSATIRGRAVDAAGEPVAEVSVDISGEIGWSDYGVPREPDGTFILEDVGEGSGLLSVGGSYGLPQAATRFTTESGRVTDVGTLVLLPPLTVTGRVLGADSRPLGGAVVIAETESPDSRRMVFTRADGTFRIRATGIAPGRVVVRKRGSGTVRVDLVPALGDIVLPAAGSVEIDAEGDIELLWPSGGVVDHARRIRDVAPGRYIARATRGGTVLEKEIVVVAGEITKVTLRGD